LRRQRIAAGEIELATRFPGAALDQDWALDFGMTDQNGIDWTAAGGHARSFVGMELSIISTA
jgi:hypothetical protein